MAKVMERSIAGVVVSLIENDNAGCIGGFEVEPTNGSETLVFDREGNLMKVYSGQKLYCNNFSDANSFDKIINLLKEKGYNEATMEDFEEYGL